MFTNISSRLKRLFGSKKEDFRIQVRTISTYWMYDRNNDLIEGAVTYDVFVMQDNDGKVVLLIEGDGGHNDYPLGAEATKYESIIKYLEAESVEKLNSLIDKMGWS